MAHRSEFVCVRGVRTHLLHGGRGEPLLVLHPEFAAGTWYPYLDALAAHCRVLAPDHLGFGDSERPDWLDGIDEELERDGYVLIGSARTVADRLKEYQKDLGFGLFVVVGRLGDMPHDQASKSQELFAREVIPALRAQSANSPQGERRPIMQRRE